MRRILLVLAMEVAQAGVARGQVRPVAKEPRTPERAKLPAAPKPVPARFSSRSPGGRHLFEVSDGVVLVNGREVEHAAPVKVVGEPVWRADGDALAWIERNGSALRLVVLPALALRTPPLAWELPGWLARDRVHWAGPSQVVVGPEVMVPRATASWGD